MRYELHFNETYKGRSAIEMHETIKQSDKFEAHLVVDHQERRILKNRYGSPADTDANDYNLTAPPMFFDSNGEVI